MSRHTVRSAERAGRHGDQAQYGPPSPSGVHPLPQRRRGQVPVDKAVHVILDNYAAHKHPKVRRWRARHPRFTFHFLPTPCPCLNAIEGFFANLTKRRLKHGVFCSVVELQAAINCFVAEHNIQPKPFIRTADPSRIIAAVKRLHQTVDSLR